MVLHEKRWTGKHAAQWRSSLEAYVFPRIGALAPADVNSAIVLNVVKPIWEKKTVTAGRVLNRIEQVLDYATSAGYRSGDNPARHVARSLPKPSTIAKPSSTRPRPWPGAGVLIFCPSRICALVDAKRCKCRMRGSAGSRLACRTGVR